MESISYRQRQEWRAEADPRWVRTGCSTLWDAIFVAFREYRDLSPEAQQDFITSTTKLPMDTDMIQFLKRLPDQIYASAQSSDDDDSDDDDHDRLVFCKLLPKKMFHSEMEPYLETYISKNQGLRKNELLEEIIEKSSLICKYRYEKKRSSWGIEIDDIDSLVKTVYQNIFEKMTTCLSYDEVQQASKNMEYHVIIISPTEHVLFDSWTWKKGIPDSEYNDVIIVLSHPDGRYDSIGRISNTKDGNQKISRLFRYDDEAVYLLRKTI